MSTKRDNEPSDVKGKRYESVQVRTILAAPGLTHIGSPRSYALLTYVYLDGGIVASLSSARNALNYRAEPAGRPYGTCHPPSPAC